MHFPFGKCETRSCFAFSKCKIKKIIIKFFFLKKKGLAISTNPIRKISKCNPFFSLRSPNQKNLKTQSLPLFAPAPAAAPSAVSARAPATAPALTPIPLKVRPVQNYNPRISGTEFCKFKGHWEVGDLSE